MLGACGLGLLSFKYRKLKVSQVESMHETKVDPNLLGEVINDICVAGLGYIVSHLLCCDYIYKHRQYVIERLHYEREINFNRDTFDI